MRFPHLRRLNPRHRNSNGNKMAEEDRTEEILPPEQFDAEVDGFCDRIKRQRQKKNLAIIVECLAVVLATGAAGVALEGQGQREDLSRAVQVNADRTRAVEGRSGAVRVEVGG